MKNGHKNECKPPRKTSTTRGMKRNPNENRKSQTKRRKPKGEENVHVYRMGGRVAYKVNDSRTTWDMDYIYIVGGQAGPHNTQRESKSERIRDHCFPIPEPNTFSPSSPGVPGTLSRPPSLSLSFSFSPCPAPLRLLARLIPNVHLAWGRFLASDGGTGGLFVEEGLSVSF